MARKVFGFLNCLLVISCAAAFVPDYIQICNRRNPKLSECMKESVTKLIPRLDKGIPEWEVPGLEDLEVEEITLADMDSFRAVATKVTFLGLSKFKIDYFIADMDKLTVDFRLLFSKVQMNADYDVQAKILMPINEKGPINLVTDHSEITVTLQFHTFTKRNTTYFYFSSMRSKLVMKDYDAVFKPNSNDDNPLTQAINAVLKTNRKELIDTMTPSIERAVSKRGLDVVNQMAKHCTFDELFPDRE